MTPTRLDTAPISLATRRTVLVALVLAVCCVALVWVTEAAMAQLTASDGYAYPLLIGWFGALALVVWRRPRSLIVVQRLASVGMGLYFVGSVMHLLLGETEPGVYTLATLSYWMMGAHLMLFITWPPRRALMLSTALSTLVMAPAVWLTLHGTAWQRWDDTLWPLLVNGLFGQIFVVATLYGAARQLQKLARLVPSAQGGSDTPLTVDEVLALRLRDLEQARDAAEAASRAKSRFLAVMSHELRTPLHGVLGAAELLRRPDATPQQRQSWIDNVQRGGRHLLRLIEDMLDLSRIEAGRFDLAQQPVDLRRCITRALESVQPMADAKGLHLQQELSPALPAWVRGDALRLTQVLINLLGNAVKFTYTGQVTLRAGIDGDTIVLEVQDTGIGIAAEDRERIFQSFVQADSGSTRRHAGSGLGLSITRQLVAMMNGTLQLDSELGRGTCIALRLPLPLIDAPPQHHPAPAPAVVAGDLAGVVVLLVDDDAVNIAIATQMLQNAHAEVHAADNGEAALQLLAQGCFDIVLMDWRMPAMDGLEATRRLRAGQAGAAARAVPVLGLTASAFDDDRAACLEAGMDDVLVKPVDSGALLRAVQRQLEQRLAAA